jgi:hypothetical protein
MNLKQLMGFTIANDHGKQKCIWRELPLNQTDAAAMRSGPGAFLGDQRR